MWISRTEVMKKKKKKINKHLFLLRFIFYIISCSLSVGSGVTLDRCKGVSNDKTNADRDKSI